MSFHKNFLDCPMQNIYILYFALITQGDNTTRVGSPALRATQ